MNDIDRVLEQAGYLETPTSRLFWRNASPTLRNHLRQLVVIAVLVTLPTAALFAVLSRLAGSDRLILFAFYLSAGLIALALVDGLVAAVVRLGFRSGRGLWLNLMPMVGGLLFAVGLGWFLRDAIALREVGVQVLVWASLALIAWLSGDCLRLLFVSRLTWRGVRPPQYRAYPLLTVSALVLLGCFAWLQTRSRTPMRLVPIDRPPLVLLAFDLPSGPNPAFGSRLPDWPSQRLATEETDIHAFWISLASGTEPERHFASLVSFETPLFRGRTSTADPTLRPPLALMRALGQVTPMAGEDRTRKYVWEILDGLGARTFSYAFWHTFPAASQHGGVLSERWTPQQTMPPYADGLEPAQTSEDHPSLQLPGSVPETVAGTSARERETWAQLMTRARMADFDLLTAYFPLADQLDRVPEPDRRAARDALAAYRGEMLDVLLERLPVETRVGILIASGKPAASGDTITLDIVSNWLGDVVEDLDSHLELAPTILADYGLPRDRLMPEAPLKPGPDRVARSVDYGEPNPDRRGDPDADTEYYEALRSLGYIR